MKISITIPTLLIYVCLFTASGNAPAQTTGLPWLDKKKLESTGSPRNPPVPEEKSIRKWTGQNSTPSTQSSQSGEIRKWTGQSSNAGNNANSYAGTSSHNDKSARIIRYFLYNPNYYSEQDYQFIEREIAKELAQFRWNYEYDVEVVYPHYYFGGADENALLEIAVLPKPATAAPVSYFLVNEHKEFGKIVLKGKFPPRINSMTFTMDYFIKKLDDGPSNETESGRAVKNILLDTYEYDTFNKISAAISRKESESHQKLTPKEKMFRDLCWDYFWIHYYRGDPNPYEFTKDMFLHVTKQIGYFEQTRYFGWDPQQMEQMQTEILGILRNKNSFVFMASLEKFENFFEKRGNQVRMKLGIHAISGYRDGAKNVEFPKRELKDSFTYYYLMIDTLQAKIISLEEIKR
ncbi:MAG: hypothetical protein LBQ96_03835 [Fusobacteriaceae bacterium]|nr:hypothetical protein [Fusobacteriaceae bacterium]